MARTEHSGRHSADLRFNPLAVLLFVPVIGIAAVLIAILIVPPIAGIAFGAKEIDARLTALGADFTHIPRFPERSTIFASDGKTVLATLYLDNREIVKLADVSQIGQQAVLATEDAQFYQHGPLDWTSLVRALLTNAATGQVVQGGSTITQQLVKNAITGDTSQTFQRKFQELALAIRVEQRYTKTQILELYLNDIYFGNGVYGLNAGSTGDAPLLDGPPRDTAADAAPPPLGTPGFCAREAKPFVACWDLGCHQPATINVVVLDESHRGLRP